MKDRPGQGYRRKAYIFAFLTGIAIVGLFFQAWRVHAFDIQDVVRRMPHHIPHPASVSSPKPAGASSSGLVLSPIAAPAAVENRWSDGDVVAALSSFYQTIITYMGFLIGVMGILSVVTLRFFSKAAAEDMAHDAAKAAMLHYLETTKFRDEVTYAVQDIGLSGQLESVEKDLVEIKKLLKGQRSSSSDASEDEEGTIEFPPHNGGA